MIRLESYLATCPPFDWGKFNCCHFVFGWIRERTGVDHMVGLPQTNSYLSAARLRSALGGLQIAVSARLGKPQELVDTMIGDIVLFSYEGMELLGLFTGGGVICIDLDRKFSLFPLTAATCSWRVPS